MATTVKDVDETTIEDFRQTLGGNLIQPDDRFRGIWNSIINRRLTFIAQDRGAADVIAAGNFACEHEFLGFLSLKHNSPQEWFENSNVTPYRDELARFRSPLAGQRSS